MNLDKLHVQATHAMKIRYSWVALWCRIGYQLSLDHHQQLKSDDSCATELVFMVNEQIK